MDISPSIARRADDQATQAG